MTVLKQPAPCQAVVTKCLVGTAGQNILHGQVAVLTGGSRGIGKGIAQELARAGAVVYITGRSTSGEATDKLLGGSVDETAAALNKLGGQGVAVHADHAQMNDNKAVVNLVEKQHGKLDCLVNNAFFIPKPDQLFFGNRIWNQPIRFLNEQIAVGSHNHFAMTMLFLGCLRRGKGLVANVSSWGSQYNIGVFPCSYLTNKAAFDATTYALNEALRVNYNICSVIFWPGNVRGERSMLAAKKGQGDKTAALSDAESVRFSGRAIVGLADMDPEELMAYTYKGVVCAADFNCEKNGGHDVDGYMHESKILAYFDQRPIGSSTQNPYPTNF